MQLQTLLQSTHCLVMLLSKPFTIISVILLSSVVDAKKQCGFVCNDWDFGFGNETIEELLTTALKKEGPADGICLTKDKLILNGTEFGLPTQCICADVPTDTCKTSNHQSESLS